ncbi:hypothetical protein PMI08_05329 [Brevibacillus sp. CF112]|uniref:hypothetical protein n=1 Tax=Brevibacillus TaxID=55080 RepID=UPI000271B3C3|nr:MULTISPECIES: hypothetical protein [unclassified Brevibacillus]EJL38808.1 hypothetical protein PMI08_05329 [Brevibacillus sp. CF112]QHZ55380.1 hypothetical protein M655_006775 [Brevibacillus sp. NSP2.1]
MITNVKTRLAMLIVLMCVLCISCNQKTDQVLHLEKSALKEIQNIPNKLTENYNFMFRFELDDNDVIKLNEIKYPYYKLNGNKTKIKVQLFLANDITDTNVSIIALQGNKRLNVSVDGDTWYSAAVLPIPNKSKGVLEFYVNWDRNGEEELILFPIIDKIGTYYSGVSAGIVRLFIAQDKEYNFTTADIMKHKIVENKNTKYVPVLEWLNSNNSKIKINMTEDGMAYTTDDYQKLEISAISYETKIDLMYINDQGETELLAENITLQPNTKKIIEFKNDKIKKLLKKNSRHFVLVLNNRNEEMLSDYLAVNSKFKNVSTNFQQVIEIYPTITP